MNIPTEGLERDFALVLKKEFLAISKQTNQVDFFPPGGRCSSTGVTRKTVVLRRSLTYPPLTATWAAAADHCKRHFHRGQSQRGSARSRRKRRGGVIRRRRPRNLVTAQPASPAPPSGGPRRPASPIVTRYAIHPRASIHASLLSVCVSLCVTSRLLRTFDQQHGMKLKPTACPPPLKPAVIGQNDQ